MISLAFLRSCTWKHIVK